MLKLVQDFTYMHPHAEYLRYDKASFKKKVYPIVSSFNTAIARMQGFIYVSGINNPLIIYFFMMNLPGNMAERTLLKKFRVFLHGIKLINLYSYTEQIV